MADYVIGDIQGCYDALQRLLDSLCFNERVDRLWSVGDLVNRGTHSLAVLRFFSQLPIQPIITLGNHDLHLLGRLFTDQARKNQDDTLDDIMRAADRDELGHWLRQQAILYHDEQLDVVVCHAGIAPMWDLTTAKRCARELEQVLSGDEFHGFLQHMYGNEPNHWSETLTGYERLRVICNYFTRMRFCYSSGALELSYKGILAQAPAHLYPWYAVPSRCAIQPQIIFGHWAALQGACPLPRVYALDTGCLWGGQLTALRLQDMQRFSVPCL